MIYRKEIQAGLDYIEEHLKTEITAAELAQQAGFSVFHYYRLFHASTGFPVMQYILRRRLIHAVYAIRSGQKQIDAALEYGFDTYAGFYKAFQREFGCTPAAFLKKNRAKRPAHVDLMKEENMHLSHNTAREVLKHWNMAHCPISDLYYESSGYRAENAVCVGEKHLLKRAKDLAALENVLVLTQRLKEAGVETQTIVPSADGQTSVREGGWWYSLYLRSDGEQTITASSLYGPGSGIKARFVGEMIGQMHLVLREAECELPEANLLQTVRDWALPKAKERLHLPESFCQTYLASLEQLYPVLPRQIIHRNPNPSTILAAENSWGMIGFEMAERNVRLFDPCYAATAVLSESFDGKNEEGLREWLDIYRGILLGYDSIALLTDEEKKAAPYVLLANQFVCVAWFAEQMQYQELYEINCRMTLWIIRHLEEMKLLPWQSSKYRQTKIWPNN